MEVASRRRVHIALRGVVQGVGFRPFIYRLATELCLCGWVTNSTAGVFIEAEGPGQSVEQFLDRIPSDKPPNASIQNMEVTLLDPAGYPGFEIRPSESNGEIMTTVMADIATCPDCLRELFDQGNRRYLYPFTNCTNCGPRFSIIESIPYDRSNTTMSKFEMCPECKREYGNPADCRFHAQPNACPACGPHLELWSKDGGIISSHHEALLAATKAIHSGQIVAVKGLGGFHLVADARNVSAVATLRSRKRREEKPFALMFPSLAMIKNECIVSPTEARLLSSNESPIVLLAKKLNAKHSSIVEEIAFGNPYLGVMLPSTPLHHVMLRELGSPVVATSGNLTDEPICTDEREALVRLGAIADLFLVHNRPIRRHVDDSILRVVMGREMMLRRARGFAPLPISTGSRMPSLLAVGAHLKSAVALSKEDSVIVSQHLGDLETIESFNAFRDVSASLQQLFRIEPEAIVADMHPAYLSTAYAVSQTKPVHHVQHHYAHIASCMAENRLEGRVLGISWDGAGFGPDGTIWGGEFILTDDHDYRRVATFRRFMLPGGEHAIREPRRTAIGVLYELYGDDLFQRTGIPVLEQFDSHEISLLRRMLSGRINSPFTSSAGRLFDAAAALIGVRSRMSFEGQAAMELEFLCGGSTTELQYPIEIDQNIQHGEGLMIIDWSPLILGILSDLHTCVARQDIARKFHNTLTGIIIQSAQRIGEERIVLSGGCFQNITLLEQTVKLLEKEGFHPYWHQRVPPNDGGIALGQLYAYARAKINVSQQSASTSVVQEEAV